MIRIPLTQREAKLKRKADAVARMQSILDTGRWPSGLTLSAAERPVVEANLARLKGTR